jgi:hypothetical protein
LSSFENPKVLERRPDFGNFEKSLQYFKKSPNMASFLVCNLSLFRGLAALARLHLSDLSDAIDNQGDPLNFSIHICVILHQKSLIIPAKTKNRKSAEGR